MSADWVGLWATGSYPRYTGDQGSVDPVLMQRRMAEWTQGELITRTGGEWREDETNWIIMVCDRIHEALGLPLLRRSQRPTYWRYNLQVLLSFFYRGRARRRLREGRLPELNYARWAVEDRGIFDRVQAETHDQSRYMRGLPSPRAIKIFSGLLLGQLGAFEAQMKQQVEQITAGDSAAVIQWELSVELSFGAFRLYPAWVKRRIFRRFLAMIARLVAATPAGTAHAFHLCWGDLNRRPYVPAFLRSDTAKVELINALLELGVWDHNGGEQRLFAIHDPLGDGEHAPRLDPAARSVYNRLHAFPDHTIYALGLLHAGLSLDDTVSLARALADELSDRVERFALAAPCGDQRKPAAEVEAQYHKAVAALQQLR